MANPFEITFDGTKATDADYMAFLKEAALRSRGNLIMMIKKCYKMLCELGFSGLYMFN